jgi:hypothetical protein
MPDRQSRKRSPRAADPALDLLTGTWRTEGQLVALPASSETTLTAVDRYERVPGVNLLAHYVAGHLGRTSVASFEVWSYDRSTGKYKSIAFDESGVPSAFEAELRGLHWTVRGKTERFAGAFSRDGLTLSGTWEQKSGRTWKPWMTITLRKAGA